jgi:hypothetical protein
VVFTTPRGLRAVDLGSGGDSGGWQEPRAGRLGGFGRGLLAGDQVFWPTQDRRLPVRALRLADGASALGDPSRLHRLVPGNMVFGHGCLAVAGPTDLVVYHRR